MDWGLGLLRQARGNKGPEHQHSAPSFLTVDVMSPCSCCPASPSSHCTFPAYHNGQYRQTLTPSKLFLLPGTSTASRNVTNSIKKGGVVSEPKVSNRAMSVHLHKAGSTEARPTATKGGVCVLPICAGRSVILCEVLILHELPLNTALSVGGQNLGI